MSLLAAGASGLAGLRSTAVVRSRQFVAGVVNYIELLSSRSCWDSKAGKPFWQDNDCDYKQAFQQPRREQAADWEHSNRRFAGQPLRRPHQRRAKSRLEFLPWRRPIHEQLRRLGPSETIRLTILRIGCGNGFRDCNDLSHCYCFFYRRVFDLFLSCTHKHL
jgi:hypothetical protein